MVMQIVVSITGTFCSVAFIWVWLNFRISSRLINWGRNAVRNVPSSTCMDNPKQNHSKYNQKLFVGSHIFHENFVYSYMGLIVSVFLLSFLDFSVSSSLDDSDSSVHSHFYHRDLRWCRSLDWCKIQVCFNSLYVPKFQSFSANSFVSIRNVLNDRLVDCSV